MRAVVAPLDVTDQALLQELLEFGARSGSARYTTAEAWRSAHSEYDDWACFVGRVGGKVAGVAEVGVHPVFGPTEPQMNASVADHDGALLACLVGACLEWLPTASPQAVVAHVTDPDPATERLWEETGFEPVGSRTRYRRLLEADELLEEPLLPPGLGIVQLAHAPELEPAADELWRATHADIPSVLPFHSSELTIRGDLRLSAGDPLPDSLFCAVDEANRQPIGIACVLGRDGWAGHRMTGVAPGWRGRGIARALKLHAMTWARAAGFGELRASNDDANAAMRRVNEALGYEPIGRIVLFRKVVRP